MADVQGHLCFGCHIGLLCYAQTAGVRAERRTRSINRGVRSMPDFKEGDIVKLKSGGPDMTVTNPKSLGDQVVCKWFAGSKVQEGKFHPDSLEHVEDDGDTDKSS